MNTSGLDLSVIKQHSLLGMNYGEEAKNKLSIDADNVIKAVNDNKLDLHSAADALNIGDDTMQYYLDMSKQYTAADDKQVQDGSGNYVVVSLAAEVMGSTQNSMASWFKQNFDKILAEVKKATGG